MDYQKRLGTSCVEGQFYETKLIALVMLRLLYDERVADFCLATNMDAMGAFDDICVRVSVVGRERPLALFIQLKHKKHDDAFLTINDSKTDLIKYMDSFVTITTNISSKKDRDYFFDRNISKTDSIFILYTNAEFKVTNSALKSEDLIAKFVPSYDSLIDEWLMTGDSVGRGLRHSERLVRDFAKSKLEEDLTSLAERFATYLCDKTKQAHIMNDEYLQQYHVVLTRHVVEVGDIQVDKADMKWRRLSFQHEFFESQHKYVAFFRHALFKQILKKHPKTKSRGTDWTATEASVDDLIASFLLHKSAAALSPLIATYVASNEDGTLQFLIDRPDSDVEQLSQIKISAQTTAEAYLRSLRLKVPVGFGNIDMVMSGGPKKVEKRLNYLVTGILGLCQRYKQVESLKVVTIDDTVDGSLLTHSGGLASAVGNVLTWDESSEMLMFADRFTPNQSNAEALYKKLKEELEQMNEGTDHLPGYRFEVRTSKLPKLHLDCTDTAREFISKLVIYEKQSNQSKVEEHLKCEIQNLLYKKAHHSALQCHSVFLHYHDEVVSWWMQQSGIYLNKASNLYELAINNIKAEPQISALHTTFHVYNSRYSRYSFSETTPKWSALAQLLPQMLIATDTIALTTMKAIQCLRNLRATNKYAVFDMECLANLPMADLCSLHAELRKTEKVLIIVWRNTDSGAVSHTTLQELAQAIEHKRIVIITGDVLMDKVNEYFPRIKVFRDDTQQLTSMTTESQKELRENCKVIFQGVTLSLDVILDDESLSFIEGVVLDKLTRNETVSLGASLSNPHYEEIKHLYIDRNVCWVSKDGNDEHNARYLVRTFYDVADEVVLLTAPPGMGKSTLLTHLSINTKEQDTTLWIVRVNFINHSKQFEKWCEDDTRVDAVEALEFLCRVVTSEENVSFRIQMTNDEASLINCAADGLLSFELNMFLHYYNKRTVIFIFDGFDEICPHYKDKVVDFLVTVKTRLRKNKMWVTSRPYSDILSDLQRALGGGFEMEHLSYLEQELFLKRFWQETSINEKLCTQLENLEVFIENAGQSISEVHEWIQFIYYCFVDAVRHLSCRLRRFDDVGVDAHLERFRGRPVEDTMSGIPLILYFMADYFVHIVDIDKKRIKSKLIINLHDVYEMFVENKLKKILFQDKNNMELSNPITRGILERELVDRTCVYKKLAANALFQESIFWMLRFEEFKDMTPIDEEELNTELDRIRTGADKTGLISHVTADDVVVFIHRSFTEYFAAEYACDILKSRKFNKSKKVLWYSALTVVADKGVRDWIDVKKKIDKTLQNTFNEIEEPPPIYTTIYRNYLLLINLSVMQRVRILASSVEDYEKINFSTFSDVFTSSYWTTVDDVTRRNVIEYLESYIISQMKIHLKQYFVVPAMFIVRNNSLVRKYFFAPNIDNMRYFYDIRLKIEIVGQKRAAPLLVRLEHKDDDDAIKFNDSGFESNNKIVSPADDTCTLPVYILYNIDEFTMDSYTRHEPSSIHVLNTLIAATNTVRCRLHHSEQIVQEFTNIILKKELLLYAERLLSILSEIVSNTFVMKDFDYVQQYYLRDILDEKDDLNNPDWKIVTFRDDFLDTDDTHIIKLRNYLIEEILRKPATNLSEHLTPDELISSFLSEPSAATLTPLIGGFIVCCKDDELKFVIMRPPDDIERLREVKIQRSAIDEALSAVRTAVTEYLRSLRLKVPIDLADVDLVVGGRPMSIVDYSVDAISELCEQCDQTDLYKVVTIDDAGDDRFLRYNRALAKAIGSILTHDVQSDMLKFSNAHQFTAAQKNAKILFEKLSDKMKNLHEYRFSLKRKKISNLHMYCNDMAREFFNKLVIYAVQGSHYRVETIFEKEYRERAQQHKLFKIKSQLSLLHYYSETVKWWTSLSTSANLSKTLFRYAEGIVKWMSRGTDTRRTETKDLYRRASYNVTTEPLISELHIKFHINHLKYLRSSFTKINSKWRQILEMPCRTVIETDTVTPTAIEVIQFLKNRDSDNNYTILELDYVFSGLDGCTRNSLWAELRRTDKVLIIVWHTPRTADGEALHKLAEAIKYKNIIVVTNKESRENRYLLSTNRVFNCETQLWSAELRKDIL